MSSGTTVGISSIRQAAERISGSVLSTPLVPYTGSAPGGQPGQAVEPGRLLVKAENLQPTGAFKVRGATNALALLSPEQRARGVVTHSSGNHAQAVAFAAYRLGVRAVVVMPKDAPAVKVAATRRWGAETVAVDPDDRVACTDALMAEHGYVFVPPYDDAGVIAGQGTVGLEIAHEAPDVDLVLVPISGGGLISGVAAGCKALLPSVRVVGVEPELAGDAAESLRSGRLVSWTTAQTSRTAADGLRVPRLGDLPWEHVTAFVDDIVTVTEDEIAHAVRLLAAGTRLVAEPSGAVAPAAALFRAHELPPAGRTVAVLSGGNVEPSALAAMLSG